MTGRLVRAVDLLPADIVGRPEVAGEHLIVIGVNQPAPIRRGDRVVVRRLVSAAFDDGIGLIIPVFDDETIVRYPTGTPVSPGPHSRPAENPDQSPHPNALS